MITPRIWIICSLGLGQAARREALVQTVIVERDAVIKLLGYGGLATTPAIITRLPKSGTLYQLSSVFAKYGYEPKKGTAMRDGEEVRAGNRVFFVRNPLTDDESSSFSFTFGYGEAVVTTVGADMRLATASFEFGAQMWTVTRNSHGREVQWDPSSFGAPSVSRFVAASDALISLDEWGVERNSSRWMFEAPLSFLGDKGAAYGGSLEFTLAALAGDFANQRTDRHNLVELEGAGGMRLSFPMSSNSSSTLFENASFHRFSIPLEEARWMRDTRNELERWPPPTTCEFTRVLGSLTALRILGDLTEWYESLALDDVTFRAPPNPKQPRTSGRSMPICAQLYPCAC